MPRVPFDLSPTRPIPEQIGRILVPVDFSPGSKAALRYAVSLAEPFGADVDVLHVWGLPSYTGLGAFHASGDGGDGGDAEMSNAQLVHRIAVEQLEELIEPWQAFGHVHVRGVLESGDPVEVIVGASPDYDLIVMGDHESGDLADTLMGNVASRVFSDSSCPVVTAREVLPEVAKAS